MLALALALGQIEVNCILHPDNVQLSLYLSKLGHKQLTTTFLKTE